MRALELNLATRPFRNNVPIWVGLALGVAAVAAFASWNVVTWRNASHQLATLEADIGSSKRRLEELDKREAAAQAGIREFDLKILQVQAEKVNDIILRRGLSWTQLFNTLETVVPYEVKMTAIRPSYGTREATLANNRGSSVAGTVPIDVEGIAQSFEAFLEFERALIVDPHFANVEPVRSESSPGETEIHFQIHVLYDPDGRLGREHPEIPHVLEAAKKSAEEGGEAPPSALEGLR
jgi:Tfp pilus assembly protein PilN